MAAFVGAGGGAFGSGVGSMTTSSFVCTHERLTAVTQQKQPNATRVVTLPTPAVATITMIRHGNRKKSLGLPADQRKALLRSLTTELIRHGRITTTLARAKEVRKTADHMITLAKDNSLHARRQALAYLYDKDLVHALFEGVPERYADRNGGYTRVLRTMPRKGDNSPMGIIELV
mmetsp:Transcript_7021/g.14951  ORF Transcript_7021/g.14951 Transcript_7021/m.14951 type:complete len:175 (+) Transcript_7021:88-612(+)